ncbi:hypothetical protein PHMEG_00033307, partial [Phytophthora megakarya]
AIRMLDHKLVMRGTVIFAWDNETDKVASLQFKTDMMTPLIELLGNLSSVSCAFEKACVTPDCNFVLH